MYLVYLEKILLPVTPKGWTISHNNKNQTMTLINEGEINILKKPGLETIKFDAELPNQDYPYARYLNGYKNAEYYMKKFNKMIKAKKPFNLIIIREKQDGGRLKSTNIKVAFEGNIQYKESTEYGIDVVASITLKRYKPYGLKMYTIETPIVTPTIITAQTITQTATPILATTGTQRTTENSPEPTESNQYVVKSEDTLYKIAKYYYGDGSQYHKIFYANKSKISNPSAKLTPGLVLVIPKIVSTNNGNMDGGTG